jgi:dTMP kinase
VRGKYIVIEGHDGTGKSTQVELLRKRLTADGISSIEFHEPEGSPIANEIRTIIKNGELPRDATTNLLLFTAARHEIWRNARQQLDEGTWVVAARNYFSTLAYQGYGEGVDQDVITTLTRQFTDEIYMKPDVALILSLDDDIERHRRIQKRGVIEHLDTFESKDTDFQQRVAGAYLAIAKKYNAPIISASNSPQEVADTIYDAIKKLN